MGESQDHDEIHLIAVGFIPEFDMTGTGHIKGCDEKDRAKNQDCEKILQIVKYILYHLNLLIINEFSMETYIIERAKRVPIMQPSIHFCVTLYRKATKWFNFKFDVVIVYDDKICYQ